MEDQIIRESEMQLLRTENAALRLALDEVLTENRYLLEWLQQKRPHLAGLGAPVVMLKLIIDKHDKR